MRSVNKRGVAGPIIGLVGMVLAAGCLTLTTTTTPGDGGGSGGTTSSSGGTCTSVQDCPEVTLCKTMACVDGDCVAGFVSAGLQCNGNQVCNGNGSCVDCIVNDDCWGDSAYCLNDKCISCSDKEKNGDEIDVDCGGSKCGPCVAGACTADSECPSSYCVDGVCCESACTVQCRACNLPGKVGQCAQFPSGTEDPGVCDGTKACSGNAGTCRLKNGQPCTYDLECSSTLCSNGICEDP